jgi:hypothetical protein
VNTEGKFKMKLFVGITFLGLFAMAMAQERTVTEDLQEAQRELSLGHRFFETLLPQNRDLLSNYIQRIQTEILQNFMDAYALIKNTALETTQIMDDFESSFCKDRIRARWNLQVRRYGSKLSQCLADSNNFMRTVSQDLNNIHAEAHRTVNQVQNQGLLIDLIFIRRKHLIFTILLIKNYFRLKCFIRVGCFHRA